MQCFTSPFTFNAIEIMTFSEHNGNIIFKKRSIDLVKVRWRESNTSGLSSSHFLLQLCFLLKEVKVHLPQNIFCLLNTINNTFHKVLIVFGVFQH